MIPASQTEMLTRVRATIPPGWLPDDAPVADMILSSCAEVMAIAAEFLNFVNDQTRIATASDGWLDLVAYDFFGLRIRRGAGQTDDAFAKQIIDEIFRERVTRRGIEKAVEDLTGNDVRMYEPFNARDTGGFNSGYLGFNALGRWGTLTMPRNIFVATLNPKGAGIPDVEGFASTGMAFDHGLGGFNMGAIELASTKSIEGPVTQADIYSLIAATRGAGIKAWAAIGLPPDGHLGIDFSIGNSGLIGPEVTQ